MRRTFKNFILPAVVIVAASCSKQEVAEVDNETQSVYDYSIVTQEIAGIAQAVHAAAINAPSTGAPGGPASACDTLTLMYGGISGSMHYSLQANSCTFPGQGYSGRIDVAQYGSLSQPGGKLLITGSVFNGKYQAGSDSIVMRVIDHSPGSSRFACKVTGGFARLMSPPEATRIRVNADYTLVLGTGAGDPVCSIAGEATGVNRNGRKFSVTNEGTGKAKSCPFIGRGTATLTPEGFKARTIFYGEGECDEIAEYNAGGNAVAFKLK